MAAIPVVIAYLRSVPACDPTIHVSAALLLIAWRQRQRRPGLNRSGKFVVKSAQFCRVANTRSSSKAGMIRRIRRS
jgi:hypothetical protein